MGAALLYGDGVITPAISVLSAMEGLKLVTPDLEKFVLPLTLAILIGLFMIQHRGNREHRPAVWPGHGHLVRRHRLARRSSISGQRPQFSKRSVRGGGAFRGRQSAHRFRGHGRRVPCADRRRRRFMPTWAMSAPTAIRRAWFGLVLPALLFNYFGQGALVLTDPTAIDSPFYKLAPHWALIPLIGLAALATIIASQALISGVFSLTRQAMQLGLCPRMRIVPTSSDEAGQIYVPTANWLLMVGTLLVVVLFKTSEHLAGAYGIAVSGTMLVTTILLYRVAIGRWKWPPALAILIIVVFGASIRSSSRPTRLKIVDGGWFSLTVGGAMVGLMLCWRRGSSDVRHRAAGDVDAARPLRRQYRHDGGGAAARRGRVADESGARRLARSCCTMSSTTA